MPARSRPPSRTHLRASDVRALAQLATQATTGVSGITEGVHQSVMQTLGVHGNGKSPTTSGITGLVYRTVNGVTRLIGKGIDRALALLESSFATTDDALPGSPQRDTVLAALNGVMGDHLVASDSPLATPMSLRHRGTVLDTDAMPPMPRATGKILLLVHGLCMNDAHWHTVRRGRNVDHGEAVSSALGYTPISVRYNSGLHTSQNGHELSARLESLVARWPADVADLSVVAHSMGGLVIRSAHHFATLEGLRWPRLVRHIVFLGTPHHGAPLERAGNRIDVILDSTSYTAPFGALGRLRSAGITDLRYGHVIDDDWRGHDRFHRAPDTRQLVPLPTGVACFAVAATRAARQRPLPDRLIGDGLVPVLSALGQHADPRRCLQFDDASQWITYRTNHMQLLSSAAVTRQLLAWLAPAGSAPAAGAIIEP